MAKNGGFGGRILGLLVYIIVGIVIIAIFSGGQNWLHQHNGFLRQGDAPSLNEMRARGEDFPEGQFVSLEVKGVLGSYATNTSSTETHGAKFQTGMDYYYLVLLDDFTLMTVIACDQEDIRQLDALVEAVNDYSGNTLFTDPSFPSYTITGKVQELTNKDVLRYFNEALGYAGLNNAYFTVTHYAVNASDVRTDRVLLYIVLPIAALILIAILIHRRNKRIRDEEARYQRESAEQAGGGL